MMYSSYGMYQADYASAESYDAFEAQAQYAQSMQSFWSPACQQAFHNYTYNQENTQFSGKQAATQCAFNLSDYSDFSDSESEPSTPTATMVMHKDLPKSFSDGQIAVDDAVSTDAASSTLSDAASVANVSDESDAGSDSDSCPSPKASKRVYARDALMLVRIAVGMCANPPARWSTQAKNGDGSEWRRGAAEQQQRNKLVTSTTSWAAQQKKEQKPDEEVTRSVKSILNKLTVEKFDALYAKLIECGISKEEHVKILVNEVFEKACIQHHFIDMYADLCMKLEKWLDDSGTQVGFRRILLNQCQTSFEHSLQPPATPDQDIPEDERLEIAMRQKQRVLGNTRLIGALLNRGMLSPRVLLSCANELLKDTAASDALESLAALLTAVGPTFDDKEWTQYALLSAIFDRVEGLTKNKQVAPRLRFLLRDVLDLRATSWANMKKATAKQTGPMKLEEVHSLAAKEEEATQLAQKKAAGNGSRKNVKSVTLEKAVSQSKAPANGKERNDLKSVSNTKAKNGRDDPKAQRSPTKKASTENFKGHNQQGSAPRSPPASPKDAPSNASSPKSTPPASPTTSPATSPPRTAPFDLRLFRRELTEVIKELSATRDTARARRRFDGVKVPSNLQATEFSNLLTRVAEERCSASRRAMFAFVAGLAGNVFDKDKCADGVKSFFEDDFDDLREEVPRLPEILKSELVPTMRAALPAGTLDKVLPAALK